MARDERDASILRQGVKYVLVGGGSALLELGLFQVLYEIVGLALAPSNVTATVVATAANFLLNRTVTFNSTSNPARSVALYITLFVCNTLLSTFVISALVGQGIPSAVAKVCMQCAVVVWNFVLYRKVIFV